MVDEPKTDNKKTGGQDTPAETKFDMEKSMPIILAGGIAAIIGSLFFGWTGALILGGLAAAGIAGMNMAREDGAEGRSNQDGKGAPRAKEGHAPAISTSIDQVGVENQPPLKTEQVKEFTFTMPNVQKILKKPHDSWQNSIEQLKAQDKIGANQTGESSDLQDIISSLAQIRAQVSAYKEYNQQATEFNKKDNIPFKLPLLPNEVSYTDERLVSNGRGASKKESYSASMSIMDFSGQIIGKSSASEKLGKTLSGWAQLDEFQKAEAILNHTNGYHARSKALLDDYSNSKIISSGWSWFSNNSNEFFIATRYLAGDTNNYSVVANELDERIKVERTQGTLTADGKNKLLDKLVEARDLVEMKQAREETLNSLAALEKNLPYVNKEIDKINEQYTENRDKFIFVKEMAQVKSQQQEQPKFQPGSQPNPLEPKSVELPKNNAESRFIYSNVTSTEIPIPHTVSTAPQSVHPKQIQTQPEVDTSHNFNPPQRQIAPAELVKDGRLVPLPHPIAATADRPTNNVKR